MADFENLKLKNQLCFALYAATNAITRSYQTRLSKVGLTYSQYLVMMVLWEKDGIPVKTLADHLQLDSATITPMLKRLESGGYLTRQRNTSDERVVNVALTTKGREIQATVAEMQKQVACQTGLSEIEFVGLRSSLHQLVDTIRSGQEERQDAA